MDVKYCTDAKVENASRMYKLQRAQFDTEVGTAVRESFDVGMLLDCGRENDWDLFWFFWWNFQKAESQLAYELQAAKIRQKIRNEEIWIDIVERRKMIEIEEQEMKWKE